MLLLLELSSLEMDSIIPSFSVADSPSSDISLLALLNRLERVELSSEVFVFETFSPEHEIKRIAIRLYITVFIIPLYIIKILVCISHVPDTTSKINFTDNNSKFDKNGVQFVINPNDEFGLTRAMWLKEKQGASVDVINVGLADSDATLRKALAIGADKAIRINMEPKNGLNVAKQIAHIVKSENYDLVIGGRESIDYNGGMVPGMIAGLTDYNFVDKCISVEINNDIITASR